MKQAATAIFKFRVPLLLFLAIITVFLGYHASQLRLATDFSKLMPQGHEYIQNYAPFKELFGGGNDIRVSVARKEHTITDAEFLKRLRAITEDVMFVKGIDRRKVRSITSPESKTVQITPEGFKMGPVVPFEIPTDEAGIALVEENITKSMFKGTLVSMDLKSALINAEVRETGVDYLSVYRQLNEIRDRHSIGDTTIHISGFAMVVGFVNDALPKILLLFGLSITITLFILVRCFRYLRLAVLPLVSGGLSVLYALGIAHLIGLTLDPMTTIIPFLVFAIGASHGTQMVKRYMEECALHEKGYDAALHSLASLMIPGTVALITDVIGFLTIMFVPIGVILELAITASIGVACIIVANTLVMTLILSFFPILLPAKVGAAEDQTQPLIHRVLNRVSEYTYGKNAYRVAALSVVFLLIGFFSSRTMTVGDVNPGEPLLWEDSVYNLDAAKIMDDYIMGIDSLSVVAHGDQTGACKEYEIMKVVEQFEWAMSTVPGVAMVVSPLMMARAINMIFHEGDIRWTALPKTYNELAWVMSTAGSTDDGPLMNMGCQDVNIILYLSDHKGDTIRRVVKKAQEFIAEHPIPGAKLVMAGKIGGVMAATNEVVGEAQVPMLLLVYASIIVLCLLVFRNIKAPLLIVAPLFLVSVVSTAFMKAVGLGLNVNTLPVAALGVGVGVDYGIYIYSRLTEERKNRASFAEAVNATLLTTGAAVLYTALTLSAGVFTWLLSDLKFQADMGLLLGFIFLANMVGAMVLLPALVYIFDVKDKSL